MRDDDERTRFTGFAVVVRAAPFLRARPHQHSGHGGFVPGFVTRHAPL